jgi:transcription-repair coupling factor (superfamily II helicase)
MNLSGLLDIFDQLPGYQQLLQGSGSDGDRLPRHLPLQLPPSARPPVLAHLFANQGKSVLFVTGRVESVPIWQQALEAWLPPTLRPIRFPEPTPLPNERGPWSSLSRQQRLSVMTQLMAGQHPLYPHGEEPRLVITSARALLQKTLPRRRFAETTRVLRVGQLLKLGALLGDWTAAGYKPVSVVQAAGEFSRRGGILDIYPLGASLPARIELFGDEVETIREFDPSTQRSLDAVDGALTQIVTPPARELLPGDAISLGERLSEYSEHNVDVLPGWQEDIPDLKAGRNTPNLEFYLGMVYARPALLLDYLPEDAIVVIDDESDLANAARDVHMHAEQIAGEQTSLPPEYSSPLHEWQSVSEKLSRGPYVVLGEGSDARASDLALADSFRPGPRYGGQVRPLMAQLRQARAKGERTIVVSQQAPRLAELWRDDRVGGDLTEIGQTQTPVESLERLPEQGTITFVQGGLNGGFTLEQGSQTASGSDGGYGGVLLHLLSDAEIFGWSRPAPRRHRAPRPVAPEAYYADVVPGDHVVHIDFGIGRFDGLVVRAVGGTDREYLQLDFANGDVLYVPAHHADRLSRWIGPDDRKPTLHRLGEKSWKRTKEKAQEAVNELADDLLDLYSARETIAGHAFAADNQWQAELEASFPYQETDDQLHALADVKSDMERSQPMDRLICGDVGYGKTEVALRAAFKAVIDGKQAAMLVPTTVLAQQHYNTFSERLKPFPLTVEMLSRFRTHAQQEDIAKRLREGKVDIVVGTHRLLSEDVSFKDLGLLVIDEEQRFGVAHKEKLKQLRTEVDVLTMTATPIPRTLYMGLTGVRDISLIDTAPADRLPVQTYVGEAHDSLLRQAILRELDRGGQVFYVHNRVQTINNAYLKLSHLVPEARIAIGHGQMSERELEDVMVNFVNGDIDVLLSTIIIESGLDIPNANTLIVERADQFGLAQLYQLRGRVGRGVRRAYGYFLHPSWHRLTSDAKARLEVIASQTELGAGYAIALRDLEIRGAGDLLGARQSGHISAVGFDLYTRLLAQAVRRKRAARSGDKIPFELPEPVLIDLPLAAYIPTDYVPDSALRLRLYRRMAVLESMADIDEAAAEFADRFGPIPDPVDNLLYQLRIKVMAQKARVLAVTIEGGQIQVKLPEMGQIGRPNLQRLLGQGVRVSRKGIWIGRDMSTREWQISLVQVLETLQDGAARAVVSSHVAST